MAQQKVFYRARDLVGTAETRRAGECGILGFSPRVLWQKVKDGEFPAPVKLSAKMTAWPAAAVDKWIAERTQGGA